MIRRDWKPRPREQHVFNKVDDFIESLYKVAGQDNNWIHCLAQPDIDAFAKGIFLSSEDDYPDKFSVPDITWEQIGDDLCHYLCKESSDTVDDIDHAIIEIGKVLVRLKEERSKFE
jgi:hypothetical protein